MRSAPSTRRLRSRPSRHGPLESVARLVDEVTTEQPGAVLVHVASEPDDEIDLGVRPLPVGVHPFEELAGFTAPVDWWAFGVRAIGTARHIDDPSHPPERVTSTFVLCRGGEEASILRRRGRATALPGPAVGTIPDLCRRVLGLGTAPAPSTTALLWTTVWLDRLVDAWGDPSTRRQLSSGWRELARRHPAAEQTLLPLREGDVTHGLVASARVHRQEWTWERLRHEAGALELPGGTLPAHVASWMDDGFYARWTLGAFPLASTLAGELSALLGPPLGARLVATATELLAD